MKMKNKNLVYPKGYKEWFEEFGKPKMKNKLYLITIKSEFSCYDTDQYIGTYKSEGNLVKLDVKYFWSHFHKCIKYSKKYFFGLYRSKSEYESGWDKNNYYYMFEKNLLIPITRVIKINPLTDKKLKEIIKDDKRTT